MRYQTLLICLTLTLPALAHNRSCANDVSENTETEAQRKATAVTLNYCRAALHRIRRYPNKQVLMEEQQRILNNLDLNQIDDPEAITLYKSVLDEIGNVEIFDREREVIDEQFRRNLQRKIGTDFFVIGTQIATGGVGEAVRSGANSWWDIRNTSVQRDSNVWKVEKTQISGVMNRSSAFLDSFWKLSRKSNIPDRWLVRDDDLDQLAIILREKNPERRLRMLKRMERFMECYPPYWYYVARTQQNMGRLGEAAATFRRLEELGNGHFRQDEMLATGMANLALIQESLGDPEAVASARQALSFSQRCWEANLTSAWVLGRHAEFSDAEDALLCNLDTDLESDQSSIALVSLYFHSEDRSRLAKLLEQPAIVARVPVPGLVLCARLLGSDETPVATRTYLASTLRMELTPGHHSDGVTLVSAPAWKINDANIGVVADGRDFRVVRHIVTGAGLETQCISNRSENDEEPEAISLTLEYPNTPPVIVRLAASKRPHVAARPDSVLSRFVPTELSIPRTGFSTGGSATVFRISEIEVEKQRISFAIEEPTEDSAALSDDEATRR